MHTHSNFSNRRIRRRTKQSLSHLRQSLLHQRGNNHYLRSNSNPVQIEPTPQIIAEDCRAILALLQRNPVTMSAEWGPFRLTPEARAELSNGVQETIALLTDHNPARKR